MLLHWWAYLGPVYIKSDYWVLVSLNVCETPPICNRPRTKRFLPLALDPRKICALLGAELMQNVESKK